MLYLCPRSTNPFTGKTVMHITWVCHFIHHRLKKKSRSLAEAPEWDQMWSHCYCSWFQEWAWWRGKRRSTSTPPWSSPTPASSTLTRSCCPRSSRPCQVSGPRVSQIRIYRLILKINLKRFYLFIYWFWFVTSKQTWWQTTTNLGERVKQNDFASNDLHSGGKPYSLNSRARCYTANPTHKYEVFPTHWQDYGTSIGWRCAIRPP